MDETVSAAAANRRFSELLRRVRQGRRVIVTSHGRPVAKLVPITDADVQAFIGRSRGVITGTREALLAAVDADWEVDADL